jgi:hypothetical protein
LLPIMSGICATCSVCSNRVLLCIETPNLASACLRNLFPERRSEVSFCCGEHSFPACKAAVADARILCDLMMPAVVRDLASFVIPRLRLSGRYRWQSERMNCY